MISVNMVLAGGILTKDVKSGDTVKSYFQGAGFIDGSVLVLGPPVNHACQLIETAYGARCVISNNGLVIVSDPARGEAATINVQAIGPRQVAVIRGGVLTFEPAKVQPAGQHDIAQLLVPGGWICGGESPNALIPVTIPR